MTLRWQQQGTTTSCERCQGITTLRKRGKVPRHCTGDGKIRRLHKNSNEVLQPCADVGEAPRPYVGGDKVLWPHADDSKVRPPCMDAGKLPQHCSDGGKVPQHYETLARYQYLERMAVGNHNLVWAAVGYCGLARAERRTTVLLECKLRNELPHNFRGFGCLKNS